MVDLVATHLPDLFRKGQFGPRSGMSDQDALVSSGRRFGAIPARGTHSTSRMNSEGVPWLLSSLTVRKYLRSLEDKERTLRKEAAS
jgi:hypothetical protein